MVRFACSVALRIASGTSRALPAPWPTRPLPSPTTTSAAKPKRRPPFTTFATRLMETSFSTNSLSALSFRSRSRPPRCSLLFSPRAIPAPLEIQAGFARGFGQRTDPAVINVRAAIETDIDDARRLGALGDQTADDLRRLDIGAALAGALHLGLE